MTIKQLETFLAVAEEKNFTNAAEKLGYAQSTVTTQIKQLECELNCSLFNRLGKHISLTTSGKQLIPYAKKILLLQHEIQSVLSFQDKPCGILRIGIAESLCYGTFPKLLGQYQHKYPAVELQLIFINHNTFPNMLKNGELDLVYTLNPQFKTDDFYILHQQPESLGFYVKPGHPLQNKLVSEKEICSYPLLLTGPTCNFRMMLISALSQKGLIPTISLDTPSKELLKDFAANGLGIAFIPDIVAQKEIANHTLCRLNWIGTDFPISAQLITHKDKIINSAALEFCNMLTLNNHCNSYHNDTK